LVTLGKDIEQKNLPMIFPIAILPGPDSESRLDRIFDVAVRPSPVL
jgi:hypothetical protein